MDQETYKKAKSDSRRYRDGEIVKAQNGLNVYIKAENQLTKYFGQTGELSPILKQTIEESVKKLLQLIGDDEFDKEDFINLFINDFNFLVSAITGLSKVIKRSKQDEYRWYVLEPKLKTLLDSLTQEQLSLIFDYIYSQPANLRNGNSLSPKNKYEVNFTRTIADIVASPTIVAAKRRYENLIYIAETAAYQSPDNFANALTNLGLDFNNPLIKSEMVRAISIYDSEGEFLSVQDILAYRCYLYYSGTIFESDNQSQTHTWDLYEDVNSPSPYRTDFGQNINDLQQQGLALTGTVLDAVNNALCVEYSLDELLEIVQTLQKVDHYKDSYYFLNLYENLKELLGINSQLLELSEAHPDLKQQVSVQQKDDFGTLRGVVSDEDLGAYDL